MSAIDYPRPFVSLLAGPNDFNGTRRRYYKEQWGELYKELDRLYPGWVSNHDAQMAEWYVDGMRKVVAVAGIQYLPLCDEKSLCS